MSETPCLRGFPLHQESANDGPPPVFVKLCWDAAMPLCLLIVYNCFHASRVEQLNKGRIIHRAWLFALWPFTERLADPGTTLWSEIMITHECCHFSNYWLAPPVFLPCFSYLSSLFFSPPSTCLNFQNLSFPQFPLLFLLVPGLLFHDLISFYPPLFILLPFFTCFCSLGTLAHLFLSLASPSSTSFLSSSHLCLLCRAGQLL